MYGAQSIAAHHPQGVPFGLNDWYQIIIRCMVIGICRSQVCCHALLTGCTVPIGEASDADAAGAWLPCRQPSFSTLTA